MSLDLSLYVTEQDNVSCVSINTCNNEGKYVMVINNDRFGDDWDEAKKDAQSICDSLIDYGRYTTGLLVQVHQDNIVLHLPFDGKFSLDKIKYASKEASDPFWMMIHMIATRNRAIRRWELVTPNET